MTQPVLLMIPGTLCSREVFHQQIEFLNQHFPTLSLEVADLRQASDLGQTASLLLKQIANRPFILCGFSMGGFVALEILRQAANNCLGLIMLSSNCHADLAGRKALREEHIAYAQKHGISAMFDKFYAANYVVEENQHLIADIKHMAVSLGLACYQNQHGLLTHRPDSEITLKELSLPVLYCAGEQDVLCPAEHQKRMHQITEGSRLTLIENCGHFALLEQAKPVNAAIKNFLIEEIPLCS